METKKTFKSAISGKEFTEEEKIIAGHLHHVILNLIQKDHPSLSDDDVISVNELNFYKEKYISSFVSDNLNELGEMRDNVIQSMKEHSLLSSKLETEDKTTLTLGQKVADQVAEFGGSWIFIICFFGFLLLWIISNLYILGKQTFDPFPFILLNLILSCLAAIQAPVIMMSQNRQEQKDRERAKKDFMINLKAELEIRILHEKLDHLMMHQQQELIEIQKIQIDMMNDIIRKLN
jgi:uncharacterized membrane protein